MVKIALVFLAIIVLIIVLPKAFGQKTVYHDLLHACGNDKNQAERLIKFEMNRNPNLTREQAISRALSAYRRDRGG